MGYNRKHIGNTSLYFWLYSIACLYFAKVSHQFQSVYSGGTDLLQWDGFLSPLDTKMSSEYCEMMLNVRHS